MRALCTGLSVFSILAVSTAPQPAASAAAPLIQSPQIQTLAARPILPDSLLMVPAQYGGGYGDDRSDSDNPRGGGRVSAALRADIAIVAPRAGLNAAQARQLLTTSPQVNAATTNLIFLLIRDQKEDCQATPRPFFLDCLRDGYADIARALPRRGDYAPVRAALDQVARELDTIVKANRDRSVRRAALGPRQGRPKTRAYTATTNAALAQGRAALERAKQSLLRATPAADPRDKHYHKIASAFDSAALLLRS